MSEHEVTEPDPDERNGDEPDAREPSSATSSGDSDAIVQDDD